MSAEWRKVRILCNEPIAVNEEDEEGGEHIVWKHCNTEFEGSVRIGLLRKEIHPDTITALHDHHMDTINPQTGFGGHRDSIVYEGGTPIGFIETHRDIVALINTPP